MQYLRYIKDFFSVEFKVDSTYLPPLHEDDESERESVLLTCVGVGYRNISKVTL